MDKQKKNMGAVAFLPLIVFLVCYVGCGITFTLLGADEPFLTVALVYRIS